MPRVRSVSLAELGAALGREVEGDSRFVVRGVAPLAGAGPEDLSFARSASYARALTASGAGAVILPPGLDAGGRPALRSPRPDLDFARAVSLLAAVERPEPGVHPRAVVASDARIDPSAHVAALAVVGARAVVGPRSVVHPHAVLYPDVRVGSDCVLHAGCVLREEVEVGDRVVLHPGVVLGGDGFGYALDETGRPVKVPQVGRVVLEDDVEVGANATIDRATLGETRVRRNAKIDNLVVVSHNCDVGEDVLVAAQSGLAGSTTVGRGAILMGQTASAGHLRIGAASFLGARAALHRDLPPGSRVWGAPALEERRWHKSVAAFARLPEMLRRLRAVERRLGLRGGDEGGRMSDELPLALLIARAREATGARELARLLRALEGDPRAGAGALARRVERRLAEARAERARVGRLFALRRQLRRAGAQHVAGVDEVGMGPLAGPVVAAAVILPDRVELPGLDDSKRVPRPVRERLAEAIRAQAVALAVGEVEPAELDRLNVYRAGLEAMRRAVVALAPAADHLLVDARTVPGTGCHQTRLVQGDSRDGSIAAASIVAKVHRDAIMRRLEDQHPGYGFARHMGYATREHLAALRRLGPCPAHRRSFQPCAQPTLL